MASPRRATAGVLRREKASRGAARVQTGPADGQAAPERRAGREPVVVSELLVQYVSTAIPSGPRFSASSVRRRRFLSSVIRRHNVSIGFEMSM